MVWKKDYKSRIIQYHSLCSAIQIVNYQLSIAHCPLSIINLQLSVANYQLSIINCIKYCISACRKILKKNGRFSCQFKYVLLPLLAKILSVTQWNN